MMDNYKWLDSYLLSKKGVTKDFKEEWLWERYMIDNKLFCALCYDEGGKVIYITLKLDPDTGLHMRDLYDEIIPGYYMNKVHWNSIIPNGNVPDDVVKELLDQAYGLILGSLSKKRQSEILNG